MRFTALLLLAGLIAPAAGPAAAQALDCSNALTQSELNQCAYENFETQDAALNKSYKQAISLMHTWDEAVPAEDKGAVEALRTAQRAWIAYRDATCESEAWALRGGSAHPMELSGCMAKLTEDRKDDLEDLIQRFSEY